jgi:phosphoribosylglycinamide formyltransferase-1
MTVYCKVLEPKDSQQYREVRLASLKLHPESFGSGYEAQCKLPKLYFEALIEDESQESVMIGAFYGDTLVGLCGLTPVKEADTLEVIQMYVSPVFRKKAVGHQLLSTAKSILYARPEKRLILTVYPSNHAAIHVYKKFGFNRLKENKDKIVMAFDKGDRMKISFLASHGGSAAKHIIQAVRDNKLDAEIGVVITNNGNSDIHRWCESNNVAVEYISGTTHPDDKEKDSAIHQALLDCGTNMIVLSGYMKKIGPVTLSEYSNKILNIHPSLLPAHGGKGMFGDKVHESVIKSGDTQSGATVQFINEEYDEGPIISQQVVDVSPDETVETLKQKVQAVEGDLYLSAIKQVMRNNQRQNDT